MTYDPNIPQATDNISVSQGQILTNFGQANTLFDLDHYAFNNGTAALRGHHRKVEFSAPISDPSVSGTIGALYTKADTKDTSTRSQVFYRNVTEIQQLTNRFGSKTAQGYWMLSGGSLANGVILMWGNVATTGSTTKAVSFHTITDYVGGPVGFPNNVWNIQLTTALSAGDTTAKTAAIQEGSIALTGFTIQMSSNAIGTVYWFAIGN